jgi:hypothetical protein
MSPNSNDDLDKLASQAGETVREQLDRAAAAGQASAPPRRNGRKLLTGLLAAGFFVTFVLQLPRMSEPFLLPDPDSASVAEADLSAVADFVQLYQLSQGRLPATLGEVNMPEPLREFATRTGIAYKEGGGNFMLSYKSAQWQVEFDSVTGRATAQKAKS